MDVTVIIPLYNKAREIARAVQSAAAQTLPPREIIVVDDGSTDGSGDIVRASGLPSVRVICQTNSGVSAARNRGIVEAQSEYVALLDGDDEWQPDYLATIARLVAQYPSCDAYATAFRIRQGERFYPARNPSAEGVVDFFAESLSRYVLIPSSTTLRREAALAAGGFPEGMRMGEDQYMWTKIARAGKVCFSPRVCVNYSRSASNRSAASFRAEHTVYSFEDLYDPAADDSSNEYVARAALGKAIVCSVKGGTEEARRAARFFAYTRRNRRLLHRLRLLNALPPLLRPWADNAYNALAWLLAKKGL